MDILFGDYELLEKSGLFDADYYVKLNPEIAALNIDPLMHYLEYGCKAHRNPSALFDTAYYLSQCSALGETPTNALVHFLTVGAGRGLRPNKEVNDDYTAIDPTAHGGPWGDHSAPSLLLSIDVPKRSDGTADVPVHGGLSVAGWALAREGIDGIEVAIDGNRAAGAYYGIRRPDVAASHQDWPASSHSGYAAYLPPKLLTVGRHTVSVKARDRKGQTANLEFAIDAKESPADQGPWSIRRKMSQVEVNLWHSVLAQIGWRPLFKVIVSTDGNERDLENNRRSLESLSRQTYRHWQLCIAQQPPSAGDASPSGDAITRLIEGMDELSARVVYVTDGVPAARGRGRGRSAADEALVYVIRIAAGDELGCDALLEFALLTGFDRKADLIYCDDRRASPVDDKVQAYCKPDWSPDLLLSTNYLGRAWCVSWNLLKRAGIRLIDLSSSGHYEIVLRLTECAQGIRHIAKLLFQQTEDAVDSEADEMKALEQALTRRKIAGSVQRGNSPRHYRVQRALIKQPLVSIVIPTCAIGDCIKVCIETIRAITAYRHFEIICNQSVSTQEKQLKRWLAKNVDVVIESKDPFNWACYNNQAAMFAKGQHLLFAKDDIEIIEADWLTALIEHVQRPDVGVVGSQLLYPDRTVRHAGITLDRAGRARSMFRHQQEDDPGYFGLALTQRNVIGVSGACLLTKRKTFESLGKFNEVHRIANADYDFCLRSWHAGLLNIYTPYSRLVHHEIDGRSHLGDEYDDPFIQRQWNQTTTFGDPYFNPNLTVDQHQITIEHEHLEEVYAGNPLFDPDLVRRILIIKVDHIGDSITALPAVRRMKRAFPAAKITVLAGTSTVSIWKADSNVAEIIEFGFFHSRSSLGTIDITDEALDSLRETLRQCRFDLAVDLRKQPDTRPLLQLSGARILAGFDHQGKFPWLDVALEWDEDVPLRRKHAHVAADLNMLVEMIVARSEPQQPTLQASKSMLQLPRDAGEIFLKPLVCVHPAAGSEMRQWPLLKFSDLINRLLERGDVHVALIGGADEEAIAHEVLSRVIKRREVFDLVGHVSLDELPSLLARAVLFVGNNSGPQHIAAALGTPTVGIHSGVVDAREWGPAGSRAVAVRRHMSCSPCFIEHSKACPRALACLTEIDSADVYRVCVRFLALKTGYNVPAGERRAVSVGETVKPRGRQRQLSAGGAL